MTTTTPIKSLPRARKHEINVRLHAEGFPTLGRVEYATLEEYLAADPRDKSLARALGLAPAKAESTGFVKAKIRAHSQAKAAAAALTEFVADVA